MYYDFTTILRGFYKETGVQGGPRRSEEVLGKSRGSLEEVLGSPRRAEEVVASPSAILDTNIMIEILEILIESLVK